MSEAPLSSRELAQLLADFVDGLIPGDDHWPAASLVGVQSVLANRLIEFQGEAAVDQLVAGLRAAGAPFSGKSETERTAIIAAFERSDAKLFEIARNATYLAYYESPAVLPAIASLGFAYKLLPHLEGYAMPAVDGERDRPHHKRGFHVPTDAVRRVDLSGLSHLAADQTKEPAGG